MKNSRLLLLIPALVFVGFHLRTLDCGFVWTDQTEIVDGGLVLPLGEAHRALVQPMTADRVSGKPWAYDRPLQVMTVSAIEEVGRSIGEPASL